MNYYREVSKMHGDETCWTFATQKLDGDDDNDNGNFFMPALKQRVVIFQEYYRSKQQ